MGENRQVLGKFLLWTFERGHIAYDVLVILILIFLFLVPKSCFEPRKTAGQPGQKACRHTGGNGHCSPEVNL